MTLLGGTVALGLAVDDRVHFVFLFAPLNTLQSFGLMTGVAMIFALFSDLIVAPAILNLVVTNPIMRGSLNSDHWLFSAK